MTNVNRAWGEGRDAPGAKGRTQVAKEGNPRESKPQPKESQQNNQQLRDSIEDFIADDMGYLKVRRGLDSQDVHLTWQFANGEHHGHYVYVRVAWWDINYGLQLLIQKRDEVYSGERFATLDKRNPSHK